jgi:hypothetical protein
MVIRRPTAGVQGPVPETSFASGLAVISTTNSQSSTSLVYRKDDDVCTCSRLFLAHQFFLSGFLDERPEDHQESRARSNPQRQPL